MTDPISPEPAPEQPKALSGAEGPQQEPQPGAQPEPRPEAAGPISQWPVPPPPAAPSAAETHPASRPGRRKLVVALVALHAFAAFAAIVILARTQRLQQSDGGTGGGAAGRLKALVKREDVVGWIPIRGIIKGSDSGRGWDHGVEMWTRKLRALADKNEVKAIVLDINSPGGTVGAVQELYSAVLRVRKEKRKPVVAVLDDVAASGGYYVAAACDRVVAHPGTLVGSIGVIFNTVNVERLLDRFGVKSEPIKSGKHKDIGSMTRAMTPEERKLLQELIDDAYGQFLRAVMRGRGLPEAQARALADGRIFTGDQAKAVRLVDEVGDSRDALALAGKLGGIAGAPKVLREGDNIESILGLLEFRLSRWLRPEAAMLDRLTELSPALEYRWRGL